MSEINRVNERIAESVTGGFQKIEDGVVGGYKKIEDKFVNTFLRYEGETVDSAKKRLSNEAAKKH